MYVEVIGLHRPSFQKGPSMDCLEAIRTRRSVRRFAETPVTDQHPIGPFKLAVGRAVGVPRRVTSVAMIALGHPEAVPAAVDRYEAAYWRVIGA